jgi:xylulokinase
MKYTLGIDIGTSGTKTALFNIHGDRIASSVSEYPLYQPKNGWAEQDPNDWWNAVILTVRDTVDKSGVKKEDIVGIGLTGQMHGLVMLDKDGLVLRNAIIWCDQRTLEECHDIERLVGREQLIKITANPALTGFTASKIMWVKKHEPELYAKCRHILLPKDYIRYKLTGNFATEVSDASGMQLLDVPQRRWSEEVLDKLGIDIDMLGRVYESPEVTGYTTNESAIKCGIIAGIPVVGGAGDNAAAAVGEGVVSEGRAFTTIGTSGVVYTHTDKLAIDPLGRVHTFCCSVPGAWHLMGVTQAAGLSLRWLRDTVCSSEIYEAKSKGIDPYVIMDKKAADSSIGANRLIYLPYLMGERTPHLDPNCRGAFIGLSAMHGRGDMIRAVMEGVCYSLKDCLEVLAEMGAVPEDMRICGGGAKSVLWRKMLADVYGLPVTTVESDEGPALGAAILAMVGAGLYSDVQTACKNIVRTKETITCDMSNNEKYIRYYEIYNRLYANLKDDFNALARIN